MSDTVAMAVEYNRLRADRDRLAAELAEAREECERLKAAWDNGVAELMKSSYAQVSLVTNRLHDVETERDAAIRELERWRHGTTVEGDFVCPNALALDSMTAELAEARADAEEQRGLFLEAKAERDAWEANHDAVRAQLDEFYAATRGYTEGTAKEQT